MYKNRFLTLQKYKNIVRCPFMKHRNGFYYFLKKSFLSTLIQSIIQIRIGRKNEIKQLSVTNRRRPFLENFFVKLETVKPPFQRSNDSSRFKVFSILQREQLYKQDKRLACLIIRQVYRCYFLPKNLAMEM